MQILNAVVDVFVVVFISWFFAEKIVTDIAENRSKREMFRRMDGIDDATLAKDYKEFKKKGRIK
jgi:hypothetical protein